MSGIREKGAKNFTEIAIIILSRRYRLVKAAKSLIITTMRVLAIDKIQSLFGVKSYHDDISEMHNAINTPTLKGKSISPIWKKRFLSII